MVMSLYPSTQSNPKLATNVVKMLDMGMGEQAMAEEIDNPTRDSNTEVRAWAKEILLKYSKPRFTNDIKNQRVVARGIDEKILGVFNRATNKPNIFIEQNMAEGIMNENASRLLSAEDRNGVITVVVQAPDGTKKSLANDNIRYINQWLMKYNLELPKQITSKFIEDTSPAIADTAKSLSNPPKVMQHRAKRDQEREQQYMRNQISKRDNTSKDEWGDVKESFGLPYPTTYEEEYGKVTNESIDYLDEK